jgi:hypothetical protein
MVQTENGTHFDVFDVKFERKNESMTTTEKTTNEQRVQQLEKKVAMLEKQHKSFTTKRDNWMGEEVEVNITDAVYEVAEALNSIAQALFAIREAIGARKDK